MTKSAKKIFLRRNQAGGISGAVLSRGIKIFEKSAVLVGRHRSSKCHVFGTYRVRYLRSDKNE